MRMVAGSTSAAEADYACQRGLGRAQVALDSVVEVPRGRFRCTVHDLSLEGARVVTDEPVSHGQTLWLELGKARVFGMVQWNKPGSFGVQFEEKLPKAFVLGILGEKVDPEAREAAETRLAARDWVVGAVPLKTGGLSAADMLKARGNGSGTSLSFAGQLWSRLRGEDIEAGDAPRQKREGKGRVIGLFVAAALVGSAIGLASSQLF